MSSPPSLEQRKQALREQLLELRGRMADRADHERVLGNRVRRWLNTMPATRLAFYWAVRGECPLDHVIGDWLAADPRRQAALPVIDGDVLVFAHWTAAATLVPGPYGIPAPAAGAARLAPQVLLIPCVAVDQQRYRLGYGGGFYDRTLARLSPRPVLVGVCFDLGRVKNLAPAPHDVRMDLVITESGVL
jgi:5,10-methenyltetrahydrofolate synthetase